MAEIAKFVRGDGVENIVSVDSVAFQLMSKDGNFTRVNPDGSDWVAPEPAVEPDTDAVPAPKDRSKMTKAELVAEAEEIGAEVTPDTMTKAAIIAAIEAKLAEEAEVE